MSAQIELSIDRTVLLRRCGWAGIAGALLLIAGDLLLGGWRPMSGGELAGLDVEGLVKRSFSGELAFPLIGAILGPVAAPFYAVGLTQVWVALRPAGPWLAGFTYGALIFGLVIGAATVHAGYAFLPAGLMAEEAGATGPVVWEHLTLVLTAFSGVSGTPLVLGSAAFAFAVAFRETLYPRWMLLLTPMLLIMTRPLCTWVPAPLGGPLYVAHFNLCWLVFFAVSTRVLTRETGDDRS